MRLYLDACIWRDYWEGRSDRFRPLGEWALRAINACVVSGGSILFSRVVIQEIRKYYDAVETEKIFSLVPKEQLVEVELTRQEVSEARELCRTRAVAFGDALHAVIARNNDAILVSRDRHFLLLMDIVEVRLPEELL